MKQRNYKRIFRQGTLFRVVGSDCVFMSLGLNPRNRREIFSFNGIDIVRRQAVIRADGRARPANRQEQQTYWNVMREIIDRQDRQREEAERLRQAIVHEVNLRAKEDEGNGND